MTFPSRLRRQNLKIVFATYLREEMTDAERYLWTALRFKQMSGLRFRRQQPVGPYVTDFFCARAKLIVELDGDQHGSEKAMASDRARSEWLKARGYSVLRFPNREAFRNRQGIVDAIVRHCEEHDIPLPGNAFGLSDPPSRGG